MKKCRNILALVLSLCLMLTLTPLTALADPAVIESGTLPNSNVSWQITDDGVLTISGTGAMPDYAGSPLYCNYKDQFSTLVIEEGITKIGRRAFFDLSNLTGIVTIPDSVEKIGFESFYNCTNLTGVQCSSLGKWETIQFDGFEANPLRYVHNLYIDGTLLTQFSWEAETTEIPDYVFIDCTSLTGQLVIPEGITNIGEAAFYGCTGLTGNLAIPDSVLSIGNYAFFGCTGFNGTLTFGAGNSNLQSIGSSAFNRCSGFVGSLVIPDSVTTIGIGAFFKCSGFNGTLTLGTENSRLQTVGGIAFRDCAGLNGNLVIPNSVRTIEESAFQNCSGFQGTLSFGTGNSQLETIGASAFSGCSGFTGNLVIPDGVISIGTSAFEGCRGFNGTLSLGTANSRLQTIGRNAFVVCSGFTGSLVIPDSVTTIGPFAFYGDSGFNNSLTLGTANSRLETIGESAFQGCNHFIGDLTIPDSVTSIGPRVFESCTGFNGVLKLGGENARLQAVSNRAFFRCNGFTGSLVIPDSVTGIGESAFYECSGFNGTLTLGTSNSQLRTIGQYAFCLCSGFTGSLAIPNSVRSFGYGAFECCSGFNGTLSLGGPESQLRSIAAYTFLECTGFTGDLVIPDSIVMIGSAAFARASGFNGSLILGGENSQLQTIDGNAFLYCTNLTGKLKIPETVTSIGTCAFHGCAKNTDIISFFADYPEYIKVTQTAYTAPTVTSAGSVTYQVNCTDPSHTTDAQKFITNVTKEIPYIYIDTITADPAAVSLAVGKTAQIDTAVTPDDAMDPNVTSSSDDTTVATVNTDGLITAVAPGTATVTIVPADTSNSATETVSVTVYNLTVPEKVVLSVDGTASAAAVVNPSTAVTPERTYTSSDETIFTVDTDGNITPIAAGTATVTVTDGEITKTIPITVADITASADKTTLAKDETVDITVTALPEGTAALQNITFVSSDEMVLAVSDTGVVTALKTGDATVTVTATLLAAGETVTITKTLAFSVYTPVTSITATAEKTLLDMEDAPYTQITVEALPEEADNRNVSYTSSDPSVLDVDADGLVIALHEGTATVTITAADGYGAETTIDFTVTHDLYTLRVGPTVEEEESGEATVETNTVRRFAIRYSSSDPEILEVDPDTGAFTAKKKGTVTVTAELDFEDGGHKTLSQDVLVRDPHEGEFRCSRCDWYDEVKDTPGIRGVIYWMIHTITHFVQLINSMT